jgi:hypothetical protein
MDLFLKELIMRDPRDPYEVVMNENKNPLQRLPKAVFCLAIGSYGYWGTLLLGHVSLAAGVLITGVTFRQVNKRNHRDP